MVPGTIVPGDPPVNDAFLTNKVGCIYRAHEIIADADLAGVPGFPVRRVVSDAEPVVPAAGPYPALARYEITNGDDPLVVAIRIVQKQHRIAFPNFLMTASPVVHFGPYDNFLPAPVGPNDLKPATTTFASPLSVSVVDTGFEPKNWPKVLGDAPGGATVDQPSGMAKGHGTFVAGIVAARSGHALKGGNPPSIEAVRVGNVPAPVAAGTAAATSDWDYAIALMAAGGQVVNMSFGGYGCTTPAGKIVTTPGTKEARIVFSSGDVCVLGAMRNALLYKHASGPLKFGVGAAGNSARPEPFYPAAFATWDCFGTKAPSAGPQCTDRKTPTANHWIFSVGTTDKATDGTQFSNTGSWVSVQAHGGKVVGWEPYASGSNGDWVSWSGTSFAAPCVTGILASGVDGATVVRNAEQSGASLCS